MPYITREDRKKFDKYIDSLTRELSSSGYKAGDMNYIISRIVGSAFNSSRSYQKINDIVGVLECSKAEFIRRSVNKYEDGKIKLNGDLDEYKYNHNPGL